MVSEVVGSLSRNDLESLLDIINIALRVNSATELEELWPRIAEFANLEGAIFGISKNQTKDSQVEFEFITLGIDHDWAKAYSDSQSQTQSQKVHQDPFILAALQADATISWNYAAKLAKEIDAEAFESSIFRKHALANSMDYGCIFCRRSDYIAQVISITAVTTGKDPITETQRERINILLPHLNEILIRQGFISAPQLSEREAEVLKWATAGKSNWELSKILNITERTVKFHLRNIYRKLEVSSRSQAVAEAMRLGIIDL